MSGASKLPVRKGLGRGLGSLIPQGAEPAAPAVIEPTPAEAAAAADAEKVRRAVIDVSVDLIDAMLNQPRIRFDDDGIRELSASIAESGIIQPGSPMCPSWSTRLPTPTPSCWRWSRTCSGATSTRSRRPTPISG
jgi:hypothetical protein